MAVSRLEFYIALKLGGVRVGLSCGGLLEMANCSDKRMLKSRDKNVFGRIELEPPIQGFGFVCTVTPGLRGIPFHSTPLYPGLSKGHTFGAEDKLIRFSSHRNRASLKNWALAGKLKLGTLFRFFS